MFKRIVKILDAIGHYETVESIVHMEFVRTLLLPTVWTVLTVVAGYLQGVPIMWIMVGAALVFMAITQSILRADELRERKNPQNKLALVGVHFNRDLTPASMPATPSNGSKQRKGVLQLPQQMIPAHQVVPGVPRTLDLAQVSVEVKNNATFPISCILQQSETEVAGITPPRSAFPKTPATIAAGTTSRVNDDRMQMNGLPCGRLPGKVDMLIKYGLKGKEVFELRVVADLEIVMDSSGAVMQVAANLKA
jgi:hypothetical protein